MADIPVITRVTKREDGHTEKWPVLVFLHCEAEDGQILLRITGEAANELRAVLDKPPLKIGARPELKSFEEREPKLWLRSGASSLASSVRRTQQIVSSWA